MYSQNDINVPSRRRRQFLAVTFALALAALLPGAAHAQTISSPPAGNVQRKAILDALRGPVQKDLGQKVVFRITSLHVLDSWAFVRFEPRTASDTPIDFRKTHYRDEVADGAFDGPSGYALLRRQNGAWKTTDFTIGPTDFPFEEWFKERHAPLSLLRAAFPGFKPSG